MIKTRFLTSHEVIAIKVAMIQKYSVGEMIGVKSPSLLDSAVMRAQSSAFGEEAYPSIFEKAAALFESLVKIILFKMQTNALLLLLLSFSYGTTTFVL